MLKLRITRQDGKPMIILGLSAMNIEKLEDGMPIQFDMAELGLVGTLAIMAGDTEQSMMEELRRAGLLPAASATSPVQ